jgi:hypothetical protein
MKDSEYAKAKLLHSKRKYLLTEFLLKELKKSCYFTSGTFAQMMS